MLGYDVTMSDPLVSVVIPTYRRPENLKRCIWSVLNQTYANVEVYVVDDNDPDTEARLETERIMKTFADNAKVNYIQHEHNKNGSAARNTGWRRSKGKYITFLDDDDEIMDRKIEKQVKCLEALDDTWGMCYTGYQVVKETGEKQVSFEKRSGNCYVDALMRTLFMGSGSNLFLRKNVVDEIGGYDESFLRNQDIEFLVRAAERYKLAYIDECLLLIHQEGKREISFEKIDTFAKYYICKFQERIDKLSDEERERVTSVLSLERCRVAFMAKKYSTGIKILSSNHVKIRYLMRYIKYIINRIITHKSYGFNGL